MNAKTISFHAMPSGDPGPRGLTSWDSLFEIGALALTRKPATKQTNHFALYQTDLAGLNEALGMVGEAQHAVADAVETIGVILAYSEARNIPEHIITQMGWLLAGLGRLSSRLASEAEEMQCHLADAKQFYQDGEVSA